MYTECRIQWIDDLSEMDVLISEYDYDEETLNKDDDDVFFYGMSREQIMTCLRDHTVCEGEWIIIDVYGETPNLE